MDSRLADELRKHAADGVAFRARTNHVHHTWARTFWSLPELYVEPESQAEVEKVVRLARACRRRLVTAGCAHSPSDLTCTSSWLVNLDRFAAVLDVAPYATEGGSAEKADETYHRVTVQSGIRLRDLGAALDARGLALPNLGSIDSQSLAGALATGTHGSSLRYGLLSEHVLSLKITLSSGETRSCSPTESADLFRAALLSLGALGIVTEITLLVVPAFTLRWRQVIDSDRKLFAAWPKDLWTQARYVRVWWFPYTRRAVTWTADRTDDALEPPVQSYYDGALGYYVYHNLLFLAQYVPRILPWVERFVFGMQYGFRDGSTTQAVQKGRAALLMNCLYSQFVNEWAIPLDKGPEALSRLGAWLNRLPPDHPDYVEHRIPFSAEGLWVHAPVEVRVSDTSRRPAHLPPGRDATTQRPFLDPTCHDGPTLYLNATLYRPYLKDPPCRERYYRAFEWLMRDLGGRPHWAKNFEVGADDVGPLYGEDLKAWRRVRDEVDPEGMFVGPWHRRKVLGDGPPLELEEVEISFERAPEGGLLFDGMVFGG